MLTRKYASAKFCRAQASKGCISHQLMNVNVQRKTWLLFLNGQQLSIQSWWLRIEVSSVQNPLSAMKEHKPTIFIVRNNPWNFAVPEWN